MKRLIVTLLLTLLFTYPASANESCSTDEFRLILETLANQLNQLANEVNDETTFNALITAIVGAAQSARELCAGLITLTPEDGNGGVFGPIYMDGSIYTVTLKPDNATVYAQFKSVDGCGDFLPGIVADKLDNSTVLELNAGCTLIIEVDAIPATAQYQLILERIR